MKTRARPVKTPSFMPPFDAGDLDDRAAVGREVAAQQAQAARLLERLRDRVDDLVIRRRRIEAPHLLGERLARARHAAAVEESRVEELLDDHLEPALRVDVDHRVEAERPRVDEHGHAVRERVELAPG